MSQRRLTIIPKERSHLWKHRLFNIQRVKKFISSNTYLHAFHNSIGNRIIAWPSNHKQKSGKVREGITIHNAMLTTGSFLSFLYFPAKKRTSRFESLCSMLEHFQYNPTETHPDKIINMGYGWFWLSTVLKTNCVKLTRYIINSELTQRIKSTEHLNFDKMKSSVGIRTIIILLYQPKNWTPKRIFQNSRRSHLVIH